MQNFFRKIFLRKRLSQPLTEPSSVYKKRDINFDCTIDRKCAVLSARYVPEGSAWKQRKDSHSEQAVIVCAGDLMCEPAMSEAAYFDGEYHFKHCFKYIRPVLESSDLALANLETLVTDKVPYAHEIHHVKHRFHTHLYTRFHCNAPVAYLEALRYAGFDGFAMANNHIADGGYEGLADTLNNVDSHGFMRTGAFKGPSEPRALIVDVNGIRLGILSYTEHINLQLDHTILSREGREVMLNRLSGEKLVRDVRDARAAGAEFLLCYIHFLGKEYSHEILQSQRATAQMLADAGIDCIMGSHPHAIQKYDILTCADGRQVPVVYSLGNFITSDDTSMVTRKSIIYKLILKKEDGKVRILRDMYIPCRVVENVLSSSYITFPTQQKYRKDKKSPLLEAAQEEIIPLVGNLALDEAPEYYF